MVIKTEKMVQKMGFYGVAYYKEVIGRQGINFVLMHDQLWFIYFPSQNITM